MLSVDNLLEPILPRVPLGSIAVEIEGIPQFRLENTRLEELEEDDGVRNLWLVAEATEIGKTPAEKIPTLCFSFANATSPDRVLAFARELGFPAFIEEHAECPLPDSRGIPVSTFLRYSRHLNFLLGLHSALAEEKAGELAAHKRRIARAYVFYSVQQSGPLVGRLPPLMRNRYRNELREWALDHPILAGERVIAGALSLFLGARSSRSGPRTYSYSQEEGIRRHEAYLGLNQVVFGQFEQLITRGHMAGICDACGKLFPKTRKDRRYCDDACSARARMKRKRDLDRAARLRLSS